MRKRRGDARDNTYVPVWLKQPSDAVVIDFVRSRGFATVIAPAKGAHISHLPIVVAPTSGGLKPRIEFHMAKANGQCAALMADGEVVLVVMGPDGYITPTWYDHENVPTWDYAAVHIRGTARPLTGDDATLVHVTELVQNAEPGLALRREFVEQYLPEIQAFRLDDAEWQPVFKLSQDKSKESRSRIVAGLIARGRWPDAGLSEFVGKAEDWSLTNQ